MKKIGDFVCKYRYLIVVISVLLLIPSLIGMYKTRVNYDILVYLPEDIETLKGEKILTDDFNMGAFSVTITENMADKDILKLEEKIKEVDGVNKVVSVSDLTGTTIPIEVLPSKIRDKVTNGDSKLMLITFKDSTSDDRTLAAVEEIRKLTGDTSLVGGMSAMVLDTKVLFNSEMALYVLIAVILCIIVLMFSLDSYLVPFLLLANIGVAILFNMGSNIFFGDICYITKAISAVLQLGVTTDFSIFLYHKYEKAKTEYNDKFEAMSNAIGATLVSVFGSSLTTIAGFLALCTMNLTLGKDIGVVMAKGVLLGLICVITLFPALLLVFDKQIEKTHHKNILPEFKHIKKFVMKHYIAIFIVFLILLLPAYICQKNTNVYYKLDSSIPESYGYTKATKVLKNDYNIVSQELILVSRDMSNYKINQMVDEIEKIDGVDLVISPSKLSKLGINEANLDSSIKEIYETDNYKMILVNSNYDIATKKLNNQIDKIGKIVNKYDKDAIVAGEGPLMKDLVTITDEDFHNVNYTSIGVIFVLMLIVLKSLALPVLLVCAIEFAIFVNMGIPFLTGVSIPFIASVVIGTIQLGATIDYAILMTTKYLEERKNGSDKKKAVKVALDNSVSSIFVSGMCFFAATIGVGLVSKIDMIGSLCTLIARGAIISMIVVVFVVPSLLLIFDKLIIKTTIGFNKKEGKSMKKNVKKVALFLVGATLVLQTTNVSALTKDETVFGMLDYSGKVKSITVNEHLSDIDKENKTIEDITNLKDILNVNGDEKLKLTGNNLSIASSGKEIYYSGTSEESLPISMDISYKLDGKKISLKKLLGKSGKVEITINYTNSSSKNVLVNGSSKTLYTPFVVTMGTIIPTDGVENVEVTNGRVISNGTNNVVVALATPGLSDSLNMSDLKSMNSVVIKYDVKDFSLNTIYSAASSKLLDEDSLKVFDKLDSIYSKANTLESTTLQLIDGSKKLATGTDTLKEGSTRLSTAIETAYNGSKQISDVLTKTIETLKVSDAIDDETLNYIKETSKTSAENTAKESLTTTEAQVEAIIKSKETEIKTKASLGVDQAVKESITKLESNHIDSLATVCTMSSIPTEYQATCANSEVQKNIGIYKLLTNDSVVELVKSMSTEVAYQTALSTVKEVTDTLAPTVASKTAEEVAEQVAKSVAKTAQEKTIASLETLSTNIDTLTNGLGEIYSNTPTLNNGVDELKSGVTTLSESLVKYNEEGISKVVSLINNDLKNTASTVEKLVELGNDYSTYTMKNESDEGNTKFVLVVNGEKKAVKTTKKKIAKTEKKSLFEKIFNK